MTTATKVCYTSRAVYRTRKPATCAACHAAIPTGAFVGYGKMRGFGHGNRLQCQACLPFRTPSAEELALYQDQGAWNQARDARILAQREAHRLERLTT
jgi:hypothetical protein